MNAAAPLVLRHAPGRTLVFVAIALGWAIFEGSRLMSGPANLVGWWQAVGGLIVALVGYLAVMTAIQAVSSLPVLQASVDGVIVRNPWGVLYAPWSDIAGFEPGRFRWLRIRLREGALPVGTTWARVMNASVWTRDTIAVQMYTSIPRPDDVAMDLRALQAHAIGGRDTA